MINISIRLTGKILFLFIFVTMMNCEKSVGQKKTANTQEINQSIDSIKTEDVSFVSEGIKLAGTIYSPKKTHSAVVIVHGSDSVPRMREFAKQLAVNNIMVLTYDKRGVGESGGIYVGPEVGTNNISVDNLNLLAKDASSAVDFIHKKAKGLSIGLIGASQAGWIIPITASKNRLTEFMVLFSSPTITTLEQLRFQFYTNGKTDFWKNYSDEDARKHVKNDPDKYQFEATDPIEALKTLSIPGLWLFGEKDIQIPVKMCIEDLNNLKTQNKPFEYVLFPLLGHNTNKTEPINIAINWIKQLSFKKKKSDDN